MTQSWKILKGLLLIIVAIMLWLGHQHEDQKRLENAVLVFERSVEVNVAARNGSCLAEVLTEGLTPSVEQCEKQSCEAEGVPKWVRQIDRLQGKLDRGIDWYERYKKFKAKIDEDKEKDKPPSERKVQWWKE